MTVDITTARDLVQAIGDFARAELAPRVAEYDLEEYIPRDLLDHMAELGFFGGVIPVELGGLGLDYPTFASVVEEISTVCQIMGTLVSMPSGLVGGSIANFGTDEQKQRWLRPLAEGKIFGAAGVTEPRSGSDVAGMETTYRKDGESYILNGAKAWISNLDIAEFFVSFATVDRSLRHRGISAFIIPRDTPGLILNPYKDKLGFRPICTGEVVFDDLHVGPEALLGEEGNGFPVAMTAVEKGRLGVAARVRSGSPKPASTMRSATPASVRPSAGRSHRCRSCSPRSPIWPLGCTRHDYSHETRRKHSNGASVHAS